MHLRKHAQVKKRQQHKFHFKIQHFFSNID